LKIRVAVVGVGHQGKGVLSVLRRQTDMQIVAVADRHLERLESVRALVNHDALLTTNARDVISRRPDVLIEATGAVLGAAQVVIDAIDQGTHVVLTNSELDETFGYLLARKAESKGVILTSDAGDQPGVLARMIYEIRSAGLEVVMAGNNKGFLDRYANPQSIAHEAAKRRLSLKQCTAFTDGTKLAIEMALVANAFGLRLLHSGMQGPSVPRLEGALQAFDLNRARELGGVVDYVLGAEPGGSVFVVAYTDDEQERFYLSYYKRGEGPYYLFPRLYHLCHFDTPIAIRKIMEHHEPVLVQKKRLLDVECRAKADLPSGTKLDGIGGNHLYGVLEEAGGLPIGLTEGAILTNPKKIDEPVNWDDVAFASDDIRLVLYEEQRRLLS